MAVLCSIITKEVKNRYENFMKNENLFNRVSFNLAMFNSIITSLCSHNQNTQSISDVTDEQISNEYDRRQYGFCKVMFAAEQADFNYGSEYNVKHVSFGSKEDLSKDIIGLANNNVAEKAKGLAGISFEGTFDALNESNDNIRVAWKQVHPVQDIYKLMFAFYCQDQINAIDNDISMVKVEIQIRSLAMDFWASLEHKIKYKPNGEINEDVSKELVKCARDINKLDNKMIKLFKK